MRSSCNFLCIYVAAAADAIPQEGGGAGGVSGVSDMAHGMAKETSEPPSTAVASWAQWCGRWWLARYLAYVGAEIVTEVAAGLISH